jgi:hypothetical protein
VVVLSLSRRCCVVVRLNSTAAAQYWITGGVCRIVMGDVAGVNIPLIGDKPYWR